MKRFLLTALLATALTAPAPAGADGLPFSMDWDWSTVSRPGGEFSYGAVDVGGNTGVVKIDRHSDEIDRAAELSGEWGVPLVALDGSPSGLSGDGGTLVLLKPREGFPRRETSFAVIDTARLRAPRFIHLDGDFSFDAISPDGETMYVIHYLDPRDPTVYEVRALDIESRRLRPGAIVDPRTAQEQMAGWPQTRVESAGGRWAYTLYMSAHRHHPPFVHALDTETGEARCIDLEPLAHMPPNEVSSVRLQPSVDGASLGVVHGREQLASIDLESFVVTKGATPEESTESSAADDDDAGSSLAWPAIALAVAVAGFAGSLVARRRKWMENHRSR